MADRLPLILANVKISYPDNSSHIQLDRYQYLVDCYQYTVNYYQYQRADGTAINCYQLLSISSEYYQYKTVDPYF